MKRFGIKSKRFDYEVGQRRHKDDYNIDHTTRIFLMDPDNVYLYHLDSSLSEQQSAKAIIAKIV
jgi:cytochrome oxidase Cu insertion factor (SCO1/SenC/PrrC family)